MLFIFNLGMRFNAAADPDEQLFATILSLVGVLVVAVSGWLGETNGTGLAGQEVELLAAPANGSGEFRRVRSVRTLSNGSWTVRLPPGPSSAPDGC